MELELEAKTEAERQSRKVRLDASKQARWAEGCLLASTLNPCFAQRSCLAVGIRIVPDWTVHSLHCLLSCLQAASEVNTLSATQSKELKSAKDERAQLQATNGTLQATLDKGRGLALGLTTHVVVWCWIVSTCSSYAF